MRFFDFCSGIGGGRLALEAAGLECVGFSEKDKDAALIYTYLTGDDRNSGDVMRMDPSFLPDFDVMLAGFPYKSFAPGGKRTGFSDNGAHVITALIGILSEKKTPAFIFENDRGFLSHNGGKSFRTFVDALESIGYTVFYRVLNSSDYGIPQLRDRVYIVGIRKERLNGDFVWPEKIPARELSEFLCDPDAAVLPYNDPVFVESLMNDFNRGRIFIDKIAEKDYTVIDRRWQDMRVHEGKVPSLSSARTGFVYIRDHEMHKLSGYEALLLQGFPKKIADRAKSAGIIRGKIMKYAANSVSVNVICEVAKSLLSCISVAGNETGTISVLPSGKCRGEFPGSCGKQTVIKKFSSFPEDADACKWLSEIGHDPDRIESVEVRAVHGGKTDIELFVREKGRRVVNIEVLKLIGFSSKSGIALLSKSLPDHWNIPEEISQLLDLYSSNEVKFTEMSDGERETIRSWFSDHRFLIISDIIAGRGESSAEWALMTRKAETKTLWCLESVGAVLRRLGAGTVSFSGNTLNICGITLSREASGKIRFSVKDTFIGYHH